MRSHDKVFWGWWAVLFVLSSLWAVANPLMASPDEPAHTVKAASVVRGQLTGPDTTGGTSVDVPYFYRFVTAYPTCYMFVPDEPAGCDLTPTEDLDEPSDAVTPAGRYNPLYYAVVGLPSLLPAGDPVLYGMRILSAAFTTFFVALGLRALAQTGPPTWAVPGVAGALTPMIVFLTSTVNPAAIEITAAFALWCQLLALLRHPDPALVRSRMWWIALSTAFFVNARGLSLLYCAILVAAVLLISPWRSFVEVVRRRASWPPLAAIVLSCLAAAAWVVGTNSLGSGAAVNHPDMTFPNAARLSVYAWDGFVLNMVGQFGWMDTPLEGWVLMAYAAGAAFVVLVALAVGTWRERAVIGLVAAATYVVPVVIHASQAHYLGFIWQGRYILPVAIGVPLLAAFVVHRRSREVPVAWLAGVQRLGVSLAVVLGSLLAVVQLVAFAQNLHRYVNGDDGGWFSLAPDAWLPPLPLPLLALLAVVAAAAFGAAVVLTARAGATAATGTGVEPSGSTERPAVGSAV
ncbi:DUF2142 domain-containing protein [Cellulomonas sp. PS-H5]|uniref:DUF2142 domain-containing protein n=1 Tax=Cellulomonas sp. PS-H5 TaxID=2820400 RepID=UPI001C4E4272|nr:DUF2142 domain-containing protein [Cellulomonas sp. PS-H5]MBW0254616.1 DUF2142 domain-containing protein [Cellulomonas sp. PS-H5]